jgi:hypothetical protein
MMVSLELESCDVNVDCPITSLAACPVVKSAAAPAAAHRSMTERDFMNNFDVDLSPNYSS